MSNEFQDKVSWSVHRLQGAGISVILNINRRNQHSRGYIKVLISNVRQSFSATK